MNKFISTLLIATTIATTTQAKTDWWDVAADTLNLVGGLAQNRQVQQRGYASNIPGMGTDFVFPEVVKGHEYMYSDWIETPRKRAWVNPEYFDQWCSYPMRAGVMQFDASKVKECPKTIYIHPNAFY